MVRWIQPANVAHTTALIVRLQNRARQLQHFVLIDKNTLHTDTEAGGTSPLCLRIVPSPVCCCYSDINNQHTAQLGYWVIHLNCDWCRVRADDAMDRTSLEMYCNQSHCPRV